MSRDSLRFTPSPYVTMCDTLLYHPLPPPPKRHVFCEQPLIMKNILLPLRVENYSRESSNSRQLKKNVWQLFGLLKPSLTIFLVENLKGSGQVRTMSSK